MIDRSCWLGAALMCAGSRSALSIIGVVTSGATRVARSVAAIQALDSRPSELKDEIERPFAERVIAPLGGRLVGTGRDWSEPTRREKIQYRLNVAGNPPAWDVNRILGLKVLGLGLFGGARVPLPRSGWTGPSTAWSSSTGLAAAFGYVLPNMLLYNAGTEAEPADAQRPSRRDGPAHDLGRGGPGLRRRREPCREEQRRTVDQEFARLLQEMQIGMGRADAMRAMAERTSLPDLKSFCLAMVQADSLGIPIARVLRIQSQEMRDKRRQRAEEKAQQVPVRIMIPLVMFILPCLFLVILGPAGISIAEHFSSNCGGDPRPHPGEGSRLGQPSMPGVPRRRYGCSPSLLRQARVISDDCWSARRRSSLVVMLLAAVGRRWSGSPAIGPRTGTRSARPSPLPRWWSRPTTARTSARTWPPGHNRRRAVRSGHHAQRHAGDGPDRAATMTADPPSNT